SIGASPLQVANPNPAAAAAATGGLILYPNGMIGTTGPEHLLGYTAIEVRRGFILSEAFVDGQKGIFIIDTGAPQLVLNTSTHAATHSKNAAGIAANMEIGSTTVKSFDWSGLHLKTPEVLLVDLSHLEATLQLPIMGLIGYDVLKDHELLIDYENSIAQLYASKRVVFHESEITEIPFSLDGHLPVIEAEINGHKLKLGLDTGSESNLLDKAYAKKIMAQSDAASEVVEIRGLDQQITRSYAFQVAATRMHGASFNDMRYLAYPLAAKCAAFQIDIDGLLGFPFFQQGKFSIDYRQQKIYFFHPADRSTDPDVQRLSAFYRSLAYTNYRPQ
ncbi:MAG: pepsin/retropepsin-like aspartic protease family protein, partial [Bacteroidota bacterium]